MQDLGLYLPPERTPRDCLSTSAHEGTVMLVNTATPVKRMRKHIIAGFKLTSLRKHAHMIYSNFFRSKIDNFQRKSFDIFLNFAQNIDCGYTIEPPRRGGSNEYPQSMFWSKNRYTPAYPSFAM